MFKFELVVTAWAKWIFENKIFGWNGFVCKAVAGHGNKTTKAQAKY